MAWNNGFNSPGLAGSAAPGLSRLAAALSGGQGAYDQGAQYEGTMLSRLAQAAAATRASDAAAGYHNAETDKTNAVTGILESRPGFADTATAAQMGTDVPTLQGMIQQIRTGQAPQVPGGTPQPMGPPADDGSMGTTTLAPRVLDPGTLSKLSQALISNSPMYLNTGADVNPAEMANAAKTFGNSSRVAGVASGALSPLAVAAAEAAGKGELPFVQDSAGSVLNRYTGGVDQSNPIALGTIGLKKAQSNDANAGATAHIAAAGASNASAAHLRAETGNITAPISSDSLIDSIGQYKLAPPTAAALRNPQMVKLMGDVTSKYPEYDATQYGARQVAAKAFSTGKDGQTVQSANTALNHLDSLKALADAQNNGNIPLFNQIANRIGQERGLAPPTDLKAALVMVGPEISKAVIGAGGGQGDREHVDAALSALSKGSPTQAAGTLGTIQDLFGGRLVEEGRTYQRTTGRKDFSDTFLSPAAQRVLAARNGSATPGAAPGGGLPSIDAINAEIARRQGTR